MSDLRPPSVINHQWRCEQCVHGEWIETPLDEFTLIVDPPFPPRLVRGIHGMEVGGPWRLWRDDELIAVWAEDLL